MGYFEEAESEIKNNWFENHVAELHGEEGYQVLYWRKRGTSMYSVKYILNGNHLIVTGDIGEAIFSLTCAATLDNIKDFDLWYLMGKLSANSGKRWDFDYKKAKSDLREWYGEIKDNGIDEEQASDFQELYEDLMREAENCDSHFESGVYAIYGDCSLNYFDSEEASMVAKFGRRMPYKFIAYWEGLKMAIEQIEQSEFQVN